MEMWWIVISIKDGYRDPKEAADNWHL